MMAKLSKRLLRSWVALLEPLLTGVCMVKSDHLESLHNKREPAGYRKATPEYIKLLLETVDKSPQKLGFEFVRWTGERLATYLAEQTGVELSGSQVRRILKRKKSSYIWAKYSLEDLQNPKERAKFKEKLARLVEIALLTTRGATDMVLGAESPDRVLCSANLRDEAGFSLRVIRRKNWGKRGQRKKISGQRRRGRVNIMGGVRESDRKRVCFFIKKGDTSPFYEQLECLQEFVKKEWIEKGNREEYFRETGSKLLLL